MRTLTIFGIKNCDSVKKAFKWLESENIPYNFHDYKKAGADQAVLKKAIKVHGWDTVINRRGTTWRKLPDSIKENMDENTALETAMDNPSLIKRPLIVHEDTILVGFDEAVYAEALK